MNAIFFSLVLFTALAISIEGKPIPGRERPTSGSGVEKRLERLMGKYPNLTSLFTEECQDVCPPSSKRKSALDCASCIAEEMGSPFLSDFLTAISESRSERNCSSQEVYKGRCQDNDDSTAECLKRGDSKYKDLESEESETPETQPESVEEGTEKPRPLVGEKRGRFNGGERENKMDKMEGISEADEESSESESEESASNSESSASESKRSVSDSEDESSESESSQSEDSVSETSQSEESESETSQSEESESETSQSEESVSDFETTSNSEKTDEPSTAFVRQEPLTKEGDDLISRCLTICENLGEACEMPVLPCVRCIVKEDSGSESSMLVDILEVMEVK